MSLKNKLEGLVVQHMDVLESLTPKGLLPKSLLQSMYVSFLAGCFRRSTWIFSALVRVGEEDGAAQQRAADRGCAANQRWGMAAAATPQSIIQRSSPSDAFSPGIKNFTVLIELDLLDNNITALPAELGLLEPNLQVLKLDGNPLIRYLPRRYQPTLVKERQGIGAGRRDGGPPFCCAGTSHRNARSRTPRSCHCR
ncbi:uncharacterized protein LOC120672876 isoform X3 [Panicum virgatum]|uniref:uncharacterized protein LOC120672876 isoform X3 n=1 Tax=Panicum virgatum TaxID=38727 RepID=UPI0019D59722|nr:uncharacterized protein LOC120672876 isoform X3 [Panicum virgatum]